MWLYDEKRLALVEEYLRFPLLCAVLVLGQVWAPFLYYAISGPSTTTPGGVQLARVFVAAAAMLASGLANVCAEGIRYAFTRMLARIALLILAVFAGVFAALFWPLLLMVVILLSLCGCAMGILK